MIEMRQEALDREQRFQQFTPARTQVPHVLTEHEAAAVRRLNAGYTDRIREQQDER